MPVIAFKDIQEILISHNYDNIDFLIGNIPQNSHSSCMVRGLIQEYAEQHQKALVEYTHAQIFLERSEDCNSTINFAELFTRLSIARAHAKISHWRRALELYKDFSLQEFEYLLQNYHPGLLFSYFPYHLQQEIFTHYKDIYGFQPPPNYFGLYLTQDVPHLRLLRNKLDPQSPECLFLGLTEGNIPVKFNQFLQNSQNSDLRKICMQLMGFSKEDVEFKPSGLVQTAYKLLKNSDLSALDQLDGWLTPLEGRILFQLAARVPKSQKIIEIGSWKGKSTSFLAEGSLHGKKAEIISIDPHTWTDDINIESTFAAWTETTQKYREKDILSNIRKTSEIASELLMSPCGLIFIDGAHDSISVSRDVVNYAPKLAVGGYLVFHDSFFPSVFQVLSQQVWPNLDFQLIEICEGILIVQYLPDNLQKKSSHSHTFTECVLWFNLINYMQAIRDFLNSTQDAIMEQIQVYLSQIQAV